MKLMEFRHKDIYVKVHTPLIVTKDDVEKNMRFLVYANIIDIDSRVQAVFAQFHHAKKADEVIFYLTHAPRIGEKVYDRASMSVRPAGKYKHQSQREDDTFVSGLVVSERVLQRQSDGYIIFAWDGNIQEKLFWALDAYYETPLLEEWIPYLFQQLLLNGHMLKLTVHDFTGHYEQLEVYELLCGEDVLDELISYGLKTRKIELIEDPLEEAN